MTTPTASPTRLLRRAARVVAVGLDHVKDTATARWRGDRPLEHLRLIAYRAHGTSAQVTVRGRALDDPPPHPVVANEPAWRSARRMLRWFESDEVAGVPLEVSLGGTVARVTTDREGYFSATLRPRWDRPPRPAGTATPSGTARPDGSGTTDAGPWYEGAVRLAEPFRGVRSLAAEVEVLIPAEPAFGVISDIDDTVLQTGVQRLFEMVRTTLFGSSRSRRPFPGVAQLYRALAAGVEDAGHHPVFYVSKSPWNLYEFLVDFLDVHAIPPGPLLLRDLGVRAPRSLATTSAPHKRAMIDEILGTHRDLDVVLIGDSGEHDPELYASVIERYPGRVRAAYIREVAGGARGAEVRALARRVTAGGVPMVAAADSAVVARHAAGIGLIAPAAVVEVVRALGSEPSAPERGPADGG